MLLLSVLYAGAGLLVGLLALAAHLRPLPLPGRNWLWLPGFGMLTALIAGWLGAFLLGKIFAIPTALWVSLLCVFVLPRVIVWLLSSLAIRK